MATTQRKTIVLIFIPLFPNQAIFEHTCRLNFPSAQNQTGPFTISGPQYQEIGEFI